MRGLLYKECRQNRWLLLLTLLVSFLAVFFPIGFVAMGESVSIIHAFRMIGSGNTVLRVVFLVIGLMCVGMMQGMTLLGDDTKSWALFVASSPQGIRGYIYNKYLLVFAMSGLMLVFGMVADYLYVTIAYVLNRQEVEVMTNAFVFLFYIQLFLRAVELPFFIRFGIKKGNLIKTIGLIALVVVFLILMLVNPGGMVENAFETIYKLKSKEAMDTLTLLIGIFPVISVVGYYLSYEVSCRLYMKGVEQND